MFEISKHLGYALIVIGYSLYMVGEILVHPEDIPDNIHILNDDV